MGFRAVFKWKRITEADVEWLTKACNLSPTERQILELRRKETPPEIIAYEISYSVTQMYYYSNKLLEKILKEL